MHHQGLQLPVWVCTLAHQDPKNPRAKGRCQLRKLFQEESSPPQRLLWGQERREGQRNLHDSSTGREREDARENCDARAKAGPVQPTARRLPASASACITPDAILPASAGTQLSAGATPFIPLVPARAPKGPRATGASTGHKRTDRCTAPAPGGAAGISAPLNILTWNAANLARETKELALSHLLAPTMLTWP
jgi:hypothetical protein